MSRTYRNRRKFTDDYNEEIYVHECVKNLPIKYHRVWYWTESGKRDYEEAIARWERLRHLYSCYKPYARSYMNYKLEYDKYDIEEQIAYYKKQYRSFSRDGKYSEKIGSFYKKACVKEIRIKNRNIICKIVKDAIDIDGVIFPDRKDGKRKIWDYW